MTVEQILLTGISAVTTALIAVVKILWSRSEQCEKDRRDLRQEIEDVKTLNGELTGFQKAVNRCPQPACTFRDEPGPARHAPGSKWQQTEPGHA